MAIRKRQSYTYQDWLDFDQNSDTRSELIDGQIYLMSAPSRRHQAVTGEIYRQLSNNLRGKSCRPYVSPFAVRLEKDTLVMPDVVVICDPKKLTDAGSDGAPDLIIEVLSPSTTRHDKYTKFMLYLRAGVPEYWIVDPDNNAVTVYRLAENGYVATVFTDADKATMNALPGFEIDLAEVFAEE